MARRSDFAKYLEHARHALGCTQGEFAARVPVSLKTVQRWEVGDLVPAEALIPAIAEALELTDRTELKALADKARRSKERTKRARRPELGEAEA